MDFMIYYRVPVTHSIFALIFFFCSNWTSQKCWVTSATCVKLSVSLSWTSRRMNCQDSACRKRYGALSKSCYFHPKNLQKSPHSSIVGLWCPPVAWWCHNVDTLSLLLATVWVWMEYYLPPLFIYLPYSLLWFQGISPIWVVYREGILNGPQELKEQAAVGLGEVIRRTSAAALKPSVVSITGPLIRILGDRFNYTVKVAVLETLGLLLGKVGNLCMLI